MKKLFMLITTLASALLALGCSSSDDGPSGNESAPVCSITAPSDGSSITLGQPLPIRVTASDTDGTIVWLKLTVGELVLGEVASEDISMPIDYTYPAEALRLGSLRILLEVQDNDGLKGRHEVTVTVEEEGPNPLDGFAEWIAVGCPGSIDDHLFAHLILTPELESQAADMIYAEVQRQIESEFGAGWDANALTIGDKQMKIWHTTYGAKPADGRSLYISLHGGGNTAPSVNDEQWNNQKQLYKPAEGVYLAPRATVDDWDMWFQPHVDAFYDAIIRMAVIRQDVNPDKVYLMGYSAGGDGVYRMAPRMADRWAACAMMAGHPGNVSGVSMRNIGFTLWVGANDTAYNRNTEGERYGQHLAELKAADPDGYVHDVHIVPGKSHWMDLVDAAAVPWMAEFTRDPLPSRVAWKQDNERGQAVYDDFYWLGVDAGEPASDNPNKGKELIVERSGNTFTVIKNEYEQFYIALNSDMVDFSQPVKVVSGGATIFEGEVIPTLKDVYESAVSRKDDRYIFSAYLTVEGQGASQRE